MPRNRWHLDRLAGPLAAAIGGRSVRAHDNAYCGGTVKIKCAWRFCGNEFEKRTPDHSACSRKCREKISYRARVGWPDPYPCNWCGTLFDPMTHKAGQQNRYCSEPCRGKAVLLSTYNVTGAYLFALLARQGGRCAAGCGTELDLMAARGAAGAVHIDHDHVCCPVTTSAVGGRACGKCVRGLLCPPCNQTLGWLEMSTVAPVDRCLGIMTYLLQTSDVLHTLEGSRYV